MAHINQLLIMFALAVCFSLTLGCGSTGVEDNDLEVIQEIEGSDEELIDFAESDFGESEFAEEDLIVEGGDEETFEDEAIEEDLAEQEEEFFAEDESFEEAPLDEPFEDELVEDEFAEDTATVADLPAPAVEVLSIDFLANDSGGTVVVKTSAEARYETRYKPDSKQFIVDVQNASLPQRLKRPYILKEFESQFGAINAYQSEGASTARVVVQLKSGGEPVLQQDGSSLIIVPSVGEALAETSTEDQVPLDETPEVTSVPGQDFEESFDSAAADRDSKILASRTLEEFLTENSRFYGRPISIQGKDADIRDMINFIASESGLNLILSDDVTGTITLKLRDVPWDQALVILMRAKNLGYIRQGNVLRISSLETLQAESKAAQSIIESQRGLTPLKVKVIPVSYAQTEDLIKQITPFLSKERGKAVGDERTNSLIVTDTNDVILKVERLVKELDIPPAQVMIEAKVVEASEGFQKDIGVNWGFGGVSEEINETGGTQDGPLNLLTTFNNSRPSSGSSIFTLNIGTLPFLGNLDAALALAENERVAKVLSSPRIVTMNKQAASINQTTEVVSISSVTDENGNISRSTKRTPVSLNLNVTPQITAAGSVIMEVDVTKQSAGAEIDQETRDRPISTRSAKTKILVNNGQTSVIGGIYSSDETNTETGVPGLRKIPILGWLFKSNSKTIDKSELLLFLTPRILNIKDQEVDESPSGETLFEEAG